LSIGKLELVPAARRSVAAAYKREAIDFEEHDIHDLAEVLVEMSAVDLAEIY
jgi:hypothetical protein